MTRRRLLDAAEAVFARYGYHDASIVRITETAGVAQGTFYIYFESKQQIFEEVVLDLNHRVRLAMTAASAGAPNRLETERRGFAAFFRFTAEHPGLYRVIRQAEFVSPKAMAEHYERIIAGYVPQLQQAMAEGGVAPTDPTVLAWALVAVGELAGMRWILWDDSRAMPPDVFEQVMTVIGRMLGTEDESARKAPRAAKKPGAAKAPAAAKEAGADKAAGAAKDPGPAEQPGEVKVAARKGSR